MQRKERRSRHKRRENAERRRVNDLDYDCPERRNEKGRRYRRDRRILEE
jgi:hypothetical protein